MRSSSIVDSLNNTLALREVWLDPLDSARVIMNTFIQRKEFKYSYSFQNDTVQNTFVGSAILDTIGPRLVKVVPTENSRDFDTQGIGLVYFNDGLLPWNFNQIVSAYTLPDSVKISLDVNQIAPNILRWKLNDVVEFGKQFYIRIELRMIRDMAGNISADSMWTTTYTVYDPVRFGSISGRIQSPHSPLIVKIKDVTRKSSEIPAIVNPNGTFVIPKLSAGRYVLQTYWDANNNNSYDFGTLSPFQFAERFEFMRDTIQVNERWETSDVNFNFNP